MFYSADGKFEIKETYVNLSNDESLIEESYKKNLNDFEEESEYNRFNRLFNNIEKKYNVIFDEFNIELGGAKIFNFLLKSCKSINDFYDSNKLYCAVSGKLIQPTSILKNDTSDLILLKNKNGNFSSGYFYNSSWSICCNLMNYKKVNVRTEKINIDLNKETYEIDVVTIPNPCIKTKLVDDKEIIIDPENQNESLNSNHCFTCEHKLPKNCFVTNENRVVIGMFFDCKEVDENEFKKDNFYFTYLEEKCLKKNYNLESENKYTEGDILKKLCIY